jgi:hypothetical protein
LLGGGAQQRPGAGTKLGANGTPGYPVCEVPPQGADAPAEWPISCAWRQDHDFGGRHSTWKAVFLAATKQFLASWEQGNSFSN